MACNRAEIQRIGQAYAVKIELIDFPIGSDGCMAVISGRELSHDEMRELEYKLTCACSEIKRITIAI
jgi:hypothetical protein